MATGDKLGVVMQSDVNVVEDSGGAPTAGVASADSIAGKSWALDKGSYFWFNNKLCRATTTVYPRPVIDQNCQVVKLADEVFFRDKAFREDIINLLSFPEPNATSNNAYSMGSYFVRALDYYPTGQNPSGTEYMLYRATKNIAVGDTFVSSGTGQNCEAITILDEISALGDELDAAKNTEAIYRDLEARALSDTEKYTVAGSIEISSTAQYAHAKDSYFLIRTEVSNGPPSTEKRYVYRLKRAIAAISVGDTITDSNSVSVTLTEELGERVKYDDIGSPYSSSGVAAQDQIAPVWSSITALSPNTGDYFVYNKALYRATQDNVQTPVPGTNCTKVTLGGDIVSYLPTLFAPAGYGLGGFIENLPYIADVNVVGLPTGLYRTKSGSGGTANYPGTGNGMLLVIAFNSSNAHQFWLSAVNSEVYHRLIKSSTLTAEWEKIMPLAT